MSVESDTDAPLNLSNDQVDQVRPFLCQPVSPVLLAKANFIAALLSEQAH